MDATVAAVSAVAISSVAAYLNAKYHIVQDMDAIRSKSKAQKYYSQLGTKFHMNILALPQVSRGNPRRALCMLRWDSENQTRMSLVWICVTSLEIPQ